MVMPGSGDALVAVSTLAKHLHAKPDTVVAILQKEGVEPAVILPFSRGFMKQYRVADLPSAETFASTLDKIRQEAKLKRTENLTDEVRAKAGATRKANSAARKELEKDLELKNLRNLVKAMKAVGLGA